MNSYSFCARARLAGTVCLAALTATLSGAAHAQATAEAVASGGLDEIIVTAQKRKQNLNEVGMSIAAIGATEIVNRGVQRPEDLAGLVPSLTVVKTQYDTPSYTLRGVGFFDSSLASASTVSMYVDQVPLTFPIMARGAPMDLERVEVLKGPQGTVFGQNSTGGLINYIAAKPTKTLHSGGRVSISRFGLFEGDAFLSGPLSGNLQARLAVSTSQGGAWQKSVTRSDKLGNQNFTRARLIVDAQPSDAVRLSLTVSGWIDKSDTQAPQTVDDLDTTNGEPVNPILVVSRNLQKQRFKNPRVADWDVGSAFTRNDDFFQVAFRGEYDVTSDVMLTSITSYAFLNRDSLNDGDGTPAINVLGRQSGSIKDFAQELRLSGKGIDDRLIWSVGGNYQQDSVVDIDRTKNNADAGGFLIPGLGSFIDIDISARTKLRSLAAFSNAEFKLTPQLTLSAGARYTETRTRYRGCSADGGAGDIAGIVGLIQRFALNVPVTTAPGQCVTLQDAPDTPAASLFTSGFYVSSLKEDNVSWRGGVNWRPFDDKSLLYVNVSRGFKSGSFPRTGANLASQLQSVTQEQLTAYELGFKVPLADDTLQLNGAGFYYDYRDKQIRGRVVTIFGQLERLLNIPRSRIWGLELQTFWRPIEGLTATGSGTYVNSRILRNPDGTDFTTYPFRLHNDNARIPVTGNSFPYTPELSASADVQYKWALSARNNAFVGTSLIFQSRSKAGLPNAEPGKPTDISGSATATYNDPVFSLRPYTLVDLRAGIESGDGRWTATVWGRNVFNTYYTSSITRSLDTINRYAGAPATYGVTLGFQM